MSKLFKGCVLKYNAFILDNFFKSNLDGLLLILSNLKLNLPRECHPGEWALHICKELGIDYYSNASGGVDLFDKEKFNRENIKLD